MPQGVRVRVPASPLHRSYNGNGIDTALDKRLMDARLYCYDPHASTKALKQSIFRSVPGRKAGNGEKDVPALVISLIFSWANNID